MTKSVSDRKQRGVLLQNLVFLTFVMVAGSLVALPKLDSTKIQLQFSRKPTVPGQMVAFTTSHFSCRRLKHGDSDWQIKDCETHELDGQGRVIDWDETNQAAKIQFEVKKLSYGDLKKTNQISLSLNPFVVQSFCGVAFAKTQNGRVDAEARRILEDDAMLLFPFLGWVIDDEAMGTLLPRNVGESWIKNFGEGKNADRIKKFTPLSADVSTNAIFEVCFVGLTNYHQTECFRISASCLISTNGMSAAKLKALYFSGMKNLHSEGTLVFDRIVPFNRNLPVLYESISAKMGMSFEAPVDGTNAMLQFTVVTENTIQRQPISGFDY